MKPQALFLTELARHLVPLTDISEPEILRLLESRAEAVAAEREAIDKAEAKRQRKAAKLAKIFGGNHD